MHSSFFHLKVIVFIYVWFAEHWNSSQETLISPSLILSCFVRLETGSSVVVSGQIQSILFSDSLHHPTCTPALFVLWLVWSTPLHARTGMELDILPLWRARGFFWAHGWNSSHRFMTLLEHILNLLPHSHLPHPLNEMFALVPPSWLQFPEPGLQCFAPGGAALLCKKGTQIP